MSNAAASNSVRNSEAASRRNQIFNDVASNRSFAQKEVKEIKRICKVVPVNKSKGILEN